jgi:hypothetical protein
MHQEIGESFAAIYERPCWSARQGHGSFLTFEFGAPRMEVNEPRATRWRIGPRTHVPVQRRMVTIRGAWHLWIYCCTWSIRLGRREVAHADSTSVRIARALTLLDGQALKRVDVSPVDARTTFTFDLGCTLHTWPYDTEEDREGPLEQWLLFEPSGDVLVVRADGRFTHEPGSVSPAKKNWQPIAAR